VPALADDLCGSKGEKSRACTYIEDSHPAY
jgi:hypothetical protein